MEVDVRAPAEDVDADVLQRCVAVVEGIVGRPDNVRITIAGDFVGVVKEKFADPETAAVYEQTRRFAKTGAKTMPQYDGTTDLVVDADLLLRGTDPRAAEYVLRHEAYHVAINERGEWLNDITSRLGIEGAAAIYLAIAGVTCEEFRVESALGANDPAHQQDRTGTVEAMAVRFDERIREVSRQYQADRDVGAISQAVMEASSDFAKWIAYLAAELHATGGALALDLPPDVDDRVLGEPGRELFAAIARVPAADVPTDRDVLDHHAREVATRLAAWIEHVGFIWEDTADGELYFRVAPAR